MALWGFTSYISGLTVRISWSTPGTWRPELHHRRPSYLFPVLSGKEANQFLTLEVEGSITGSQCMFHSPDSVGWGSQMLWWLACQTRPGENSGMKLAGIPWTNDNFSPYSTFWEYICYSLFPGRRLEYHLPVFPLPFSRACCVVCHKNQTLYLDKLIYTI